ncbi:MAG: 3-dehydroquinate synthase, partial [Hyphomicrobiaceae bacterium]|nr:3-dehydroquinate synthase [Hyphomicrobiaceae bacterium]
MNSPTNQHQTVHVALGTRAYDVVIGTNLLVNIGTIFAERFATARVAIVTDDTVAKHHLPTLQQALGERVRGTVIVAPGEASKNFTTLADVTNQLLSFGAERDDDIAAFD